jgi:hypothetical protein
MNENHNFDILDFSRYNILHISPICYEKNYMCFHNIKISIEQLGLITEQEILVDGLTITKYMRQNSIDIPFHFSQYTSKGHLN